MKTPVQQNATSNNHSFVTYQPTDAKHILNWSQNSPRQPQRVNSSSRTVPNNDSFSTRQSRPKQAPWPFLRSSTSLPGTYQSNQRPPLSCNLHFFFFICNRDGLPTAVQRVKMSLVKDRAAARGVVNSVSVLTITPVSGPRR